MTTSDQSPPDTPNLSDLQGSPDETPQVPARVALLAADQAVRVVEEAERTDPDPDSPGWWPKEFVFEVTNIPGYEDVEFSYDFIDEPRTVADYLFGSLIFTNSDRNIGTTREFLKKALKPGEFEKFQADFQELNDAAFAAETSLDWEGILGKVADVLDQLVDQFSPKGPRRSTGRSRTGRRRKSRRGRN